ncbi:efflux RND transporter periplasmic adaptor subunit [Bradyrhizobium lablabi]|uniref:efflux RND transporter periplasmic adaptor subunit n=1 Tax=Bradyrhizobium lablabi TaxID=722472 RepID=UPI001BA53497|nr:efflux RND transporter periplasmic adaptor subunit [Bradyrhizobium lablabi]MBR1125414.1 efflux RND transporter periplasmic adaptor subunit [Bradyrhizobium lablabi]
MKLKLQHLVATGVLAVALTGSGFYAWSHFLHPPLVTTAIASLAPVSEAVYGTGTVEPERWAKVVPLQRRRLIELCNCEGQAVRAGQVLGRQDDAEERSALQQLEINRGQLERDLARAEKDRGKSDAARTEYEQRWTKHEEAKSRIAAQKVLIDSLVLKAPLDGMVLRRDGEVGEIAGPTDVLFWVGPPAPMQVVAEINEEEINRIAAGQKALLRSEAFPDRALRATVSQITPKGDPTRKTFRVYLRLPPDTPLRIGMSVDVNIIFREKQAAIVVPAESLAGDFVQVADDGRARRVPVTVGIRGSRNVEAIGDLPKGTPVLSPARTELADGARIRIDSSATRATVEPAEANEPADQPGVTPDNATVAMATATPSDPDDAVVSAAITAHIDSVINDARRRNTIKNGR